MTIFAKSVERIIMNREFRVGNRLEIDWENNFPLNYQENKSIDKQPIGHGIVLKVTYDFITTKWDWTPIYHWNVFDVASTIAKATKIISQIKCPMCNGDFFLEDDYLCSDCRSLL
jgi:hypothetical protein